MMVKIFQMESSKLLKLKMKFFQMMKKTKKKPEKSTCLLFVVQIICSKFESIDKFFNLGAISNTIDSLLKKSNKTNANYSKNSLEYKMIKEDSE